MGKVTEPEILEKYEVGKMIGSGAFSEVYLSKDKKSGKQYALKVIDKTGSGSTKEALEAEVNILRKINHKNVIGLHEVVETATHLFVIMQLVTGGELFDAIVERGYYTERDAAVVVKQLLEGIQYLHSNGIVHRDLKPENILYQTEDKNSPVMISDFGLSKLRDNKDHGMPMVMSTVCGTPGYVAPEVLKKQKYSEPVDAWAVGVISYILLCGYPPFYDDNNAKLFNLIMKGKYEFDSPYWDEISSTAKNFVKKLLVGDPSQRMTIKEALEHDFVTVMTGKDDLKNIHSSVAEQLVKSKAARAEWKKAINAKKFIDIIGKLAVTPKLGTKVDHGKKGPAGKNLETP
eukprot:Nk52_evm1s1348 gene=Nk52_evmTU1s1348